MVREWEIRGDIIRPMADSSRTKEKYFPLAALLLCLLTYGLLSPWLGFYFDDWPVITTLKLRGLDTFWEFYRGERPFSAWTYIITGPWLGVRPWVWQLFSMFVRWLTTLGMWWSLGVLWPQRKREVTWMALLFIVYPAFDQQAIAVAYSQHWMIYGLFFLSLGAMLQAVRSPRRAIGWTILGVIACIAHVWSMEYFTGLELLRPVFLWIVTAEVFSSRKSRIVIVLKRWLPYLLVLVAFILWRLLVLPQQGSDPNQPDLLYSLFTQPLSTILALLQYAVQDFLNIVFGAWQKVLEPSVYVLTDWMVIFSLVMGTIAGLGTFLMLRWMFKDKDENGRTTAASAEEQRKWLLEAVLLGMLGVLLGTLPVWLTDRQTTLGLYGSRFSLAATFGASILTVAALEWLTVRRLARLILLGALVGLAVGFHVRRANDFRWSWIKQNRFYWQLYWRAPELKSGALIASDGEIFPYVGRYSTSLALNLLYPEDLSYPDVGHWFYEFTPELIRHPEVMAQGKPIEFLFRNFHYSGSTLDSVVINYEPESGKCLWVLPPDEVDNPDLPALTLGGVALSNLSMIEDAGTTNTALQAGIFGPEPDHGWCYYFQKADLARQNGDWAHVAELGDIAKEQGYSPNNPQEWVPFIEGYAHTGRWETAIQLTRQVYKVNFRTAPKLCRVWNKIVTITEPPAEFQPALIELYERLECN